MNNEIQEMDMEIETISFYNWMQTNDIQTKEIVLWHALMNLSLSAGWIEWASIALSTLKSKTGLKKDAIYEARENLKDLGRIEVIPGKGNKSPKYRLIPFGKVEAKSPKPSLVKKVEEIEEVIEVKDTNKVKEEVDTEKPPIEPVKELKKDIKIFKKVQQLIPQLSPKDISAFTSYLEQGLEDELLCEAIDIANRELEGKRNMERLNYAKGIMRNWYNDNIKTLKEHLEYEKEREESKKNEGNRGNNKQYKQPDKEAPETSIRPFRVPE